MTSNFLILTPSVSYLDYGIIYTRVLDTSALANNNIIMRSPYVVWTPVPSNSQKLEMLGGVHVGLCLQCEQVAGHMSPYATAALAPAPSLNKTNKQATQNCRATVHQFAYDPVSTFALTALKHFGWKKSNANGSCFAVCSTPFFASWG